MVVDPRRPGHSLPELIVAVTFLATTAAVVGSMTIVGARWTSEAVTRQEAVRVAEVVLDSLAVAPPVVPGGMPRDGFTVRWAPVGVSNVRVTVSWRTESSPVSLLGRMVIPVPVLPDAAPDSVDRFVMGPGP